MRFKKFLKWFGKFIISSILAFALLTGFAFFYYNLPVRYSTKDGATDYSWEKNKFYSRGTEGFAWGKTNNEGYMNLYDYEEGMDIDILLMGSSHMEGFNVDMKDTTASRLDAMLPDDVVYNLGISGHEFTVCANNLDAALEKYKPKKYVILETPTLKFSEDELKSAIDGTVAELPAKSGGILGTLQKIPFIRLMYLKLSSFFKTDAPPPVLESELSGDIEGLYNQLISQMAKKVEDAGAELIIIYHKNVNIAEDGSAYILENADRREYFANSCKANGVHFIDLTDKILEDYEENHVLLHGFSNSSLGSGHLNSYGHSVLAQALYDYIVSEVE